MSIFDVLHDNAVSDNDLLAKNDQRGDVFTRPRDVDFAFKTNDREHADALCEFINGKNFGKAQVSEGKDRTFWIVCVIHMPITQTLLCSVSGFMACLSQLFKVEYDGWGSVIQSETVPPPKDR
jgi:hypothetical protein